MIAYCERRGHGSVRALRDVSGDLGNEIREEGCNGTYGYY